MQRRKTSLSKYQRLQSLLAASVKVHFFPETMLQYAGGKVLLELTKQQNWDPYALLEVIRKSRLPIVQPDLTEI